MNHFILFRLSSVYYEWREDSHSNRKKLLRFSVSCLIPNLGLRECTEKWNNIIEPTNTYLLTFCIPTLRKIIKVGSYLMKIETLPPNPHCCNRSAVANAKINMKVVTLLLFARKMWHSCSSCQEPKVLKLQGGSRLICDRPRCGLE